jgi:hypothetical protein
MGSYNNTSLSGTVFEGDKVVFFAIIPTINKIHGFYKPVSFPISATYADCGRYDIEPESQENFILLLDFLNKHNANSEKITNDNFWELFHNNEIKPKLVGYGKEEKRDFFISSVHKSYFDEVLKQNFNTYMGDRNVDIFLEMLKNMDFERQKERLIQLFKTGVSVEILKDLYDSPGSNSVMADSLERDQSLGGFFKPIIKELSPEMIVENGNLVFKKTEKNNIAIGVAQTLQFLKWLDECNLDFVPNNYGGQEYSIQAQEKHLSLLEQVLNDRKDYYEYYYDLLEKNGISYENLTPEQVTKEGKTIELLEKLKDIVKLKDNVKDLAIKLKIGN